MFFNSTTLRFKIVQNSHQIIGKLQDPKYFEALEMAKRQEFPGALPLRPYTGAALDPMGAPRPLAALGNDLWPLRAFYVHLNEIHCLGFSTAQLHSLPSLLRSRIHI